MTQPGQGILFELTNPLVGEVELGAQLPQGTARLPVQTIASDNDHTQAVGQAGKQSAQSIIHQAPIDVLIHISRLQPRRRDQPTSPIAPRKALKKSLRTLDVCI
jgi:hypothetical protein